jgi:hypothetical protein
MRLMLNSDLRDGLVDDSVQQREEIFPHFLVISSASQVCNSCQGQISETACFSPVLDCIMSRRLMLVDNSVQQQEEKLPPFPSDIIGIASLQLMLKSDFRDGLL